MIVWITLGLLVTLWPAYAASEVSRCRSIVPAIERLHCYDGEFPPAVSGKSLQRAVDDKLIVAAQTMLRTKLRNPQSGVVSNLVLRTAVDGSTAVCGTISSKNDTDGMTGPVPFVYDGIAVHFLIASDGAENGTIYNGASLMRAFELANQLHERFCR